ncbi:hypothetical protein MTO96_051873 [Rhipicephalus appendiculatus]
MTHILVKWVHDQIWDVYPIKVVLEPAVGLRLLNDSAYFKELHGTVLNVRWSDTEDPAPAELLSIGEPRSLERKRAKLASAAAIAGSPVAAEPESTVAASREDDTPRCTCAKRVQQLEEEVEVLKKCVDMVALTRGT